NSGSLLPLSPRHDYDACRFPIAYVVRPKTFPSGEHPPLYRELCLCLSADRLQQADSTSDDPGTSMIERFLPERLRSAWAGEQAINSMRSGLDRDDFYILCLDNETPRDIDEKSTQ